MGIGGFEFLIIAFVLVASFGLPVVLIVFAVRVMRAGPAAPLVPVVPLQDGTSASRCASCNALYSAEYDACPYCARQVVAEASLDVTKWANSKVWSLLAASVWPFAYIFIFVAVAASLAAAGGSGSSEPPAGVFALLGAHIFTMVLGFALMGVYLYIAIKSPIASNAKVLWAVALLLSSMLAFPFAFYFLVWEPRAKAKRLQASPAGEPKAQAAHANKRILTRKR